MDQYVYHGTDPGSVEDILKEGLLPRNATGKSQWSENNMESIPNHVYLTRMWGIFFGMSAVEYPDPFAVVEIQLDRLDESKLYPDEDFMEQAFRKRPDLAPSGFDDMPLAKRTALISATIEKYQDDWRKSLEGLGNISHKGPIDSSAITRVSVVDAPRRFWRLLDPTISIINAEASEDHYKMLTRLIMDEGVTTDEFAAALGVPKEDAQELLSNTSWDVRDVNR